MVFAGALLRKMHPQASVYVINVDDFFDRDVRPPAKSVMYDPQGRTRYEGKQFWQHVQERVCNRFARLCGRKAVIFRSRETGAYYSHEPDAMIPISYDAAVSQDEVDRETTAATDFLKQFTQGKCVILTQVPTVGTKIGDANAVAGALGMKLITPEIADGLQTVDGSHLDGPSAERWSQAFFEAAGPEIRSCLEKHRASAS